MHSDTNMTISLTDRNSSSLPLSTCSTLPSSLPVSKSELGATRKTNAFSKGSAWGLGFHKAGFALSSLPASSLRGLANKLAVGQSAIDPLWTPAPAVVDVGLQAGRIVASVNAEHMAPTWTARAGALYDW